MSSLSDSRFVTGVELGRRLGISRAAVQKRIAGLLHEGLPVYAVRGKGYRLLPGVRMLEEKAIRTALNKETAHHVSGVEILPQVSSTNQWLADYAKEKSIHGVLCLTEAQTAGRGRRGRRWYSTPYRNVMLSLGWAYDQWNPQLPTIGLIAGLCISQALEDSGVHGVQVKWPNDLMFQGRKLGGVLIDVAGEAHSACQIIIGVGINISVDQKERDQIDVPWTDIETIQSDPLDRNLLIAGCINRIVPALASFPARDLAAYLEHYRSRDALSGKRVTVVSGDNERVVGKAVGVTSDGLLRVLVEDGEIKTFSQGDVRVTQQ